MNKNAYVAALLFLSCSAVANEDNLPGILNRAPVVLSGIAAMQEFKAGFESSGATLGAELVGFGSQFESRDAAVASVFHLSSPGEIKDARYDCHYHGGLGDEVGSAHCHGAGVSEGRSYVAAPGSFSVVDFTKAAESAVTLFERALGNPKDILQAKLWRSYAGNEAGIQVQLVWLKQDGTEATNYLYCHNHEHGGVVEIDCHRQRAPGTFQP